MKVTWKDKGFLGKLRALHEAERLEVSVRTDGIRRFVLKNAYGSFNEDAHSQTRQGVRWRFNRLFNDIYVSAFETIYFIESNFGTDLRQEAMEIAKERAELWRQAKEELDTGERHEPAKD